MAYYIVERSGKRINPWMQEHPFSLADRVDVQATRSSLAKQGHMVVYKNRNSLVLIGSYPFTAAQAREASLFVSNFVAGRVVFDISDGGPWQQAIYPTKAAIGILRRLGSLSANILPTDIRCLPDGLASPQLTDDLPDLG